MPLGNKIELLKKFHVEVKTHLQRQNRATSNDTASTGGFQYAKYNI